MIFQGITAVTNCDNCPSFSWNKPIFKINLLRIHGVFIALCWVVTLMPFQDIFVTETRFTLEEIFPDSRRIRNVLVPDLFCRLHTGGRIRNKIVPVWSRLRRFWIRNLKWELCIRILLNPEHFFCGIWVHSRPLFGKSIELTNYLINVSAWI